MSLLLQFAARKTNLTFESAGLLAFDAPPAAANKLEVPCLLFYEGQHTSMQGKGVSYSAAQIQAIADATNAWINGGRRVKLYSGQKDHSISQGSTIGFLVGSVTAEPITADKLPLPGLDALIGKMGVFGTVQIAGESNVAQYLDGRLKELSVGLTPKNEIVEISAVSIPSLAGAALFAAGEELTFDEAIAQVQETLTYALSLSDQMQEDAVRKAEMQLYRLFESFMEVLHDIRNTATENPDQLNGQTPEALRAKAVQDLITALQGQLNVTPPAPDPTPLPTIPFFGDSMNLEQMAAQIKTLEDGKAATDQQLAAQNRQIALFAHREILADRWTTLRQKATQLLEAGKLTPASFKQKFEGKAAPAIAQFSAAQLDDAEKAVNEFERDCDRLGYLLEDLEANGVAVKFGMPVEGEDLTAPTQDETDKKVEAVAKDYKPRAIY